MTCSYCDAEVGGDIGTFSYSYVPGAGDDEESWARGLTPALFWQHHQVTTAHVSMNLATTKSGRVISNPILVAISYACFCSGHLTCYDS